MQPYCPCRAGGKRTHSLQHGLGRNDEADADLCGCADLVVLASASQGALLCQAFPGAAYVNLLSTACHAFCLMLFCSSIQLQSSGGSLEAAQMQARCVMEVKGMKLWNYCRAQACIWISQLLAQTYFECILLASGMEEIKRQANWAITGCVLLATWFVHRSRSAMVSSPEMYNPQLRYNSQGSCHALVDFLKPDCCDELLEWIPFRVRGLEQQEQNNSSLHDKPRLKQE
eukprot:1159295-Pelagomonas_calceolata.AAC.9